ncbi:hypothetical protein EDD18DRAFT_1462897 [Armillaria luteobubalina]|uniref:Uncharacterized protein n=1 Tax=Armillaria luteobubalina TaxID=153913 RepID=A0AA39Q6Y4_9AGAR|nr:hypothetical protein EDD18DRAFT_1462897 [Armillaria luteobubalina]
MEHENAANVDHADNYLDALKNLPKLPDTQGAPDEQVAEGWCGPESQPDNVEDDDDVTIDLGSQSSAPPKQKLKRKSSAISSDLPPAQFGPASNTRSMVGQTEASFLSAGGDLSLFFIYIVYKEVPVFRS